MSSNLRCAEGLVLKMRDNFIRPARPVLRTPGNHRLAVAALHQALATDPAYGAAFRKSAGIDHPAAADPRAQRRWWATTIATVLDIPADQ